MTSKHYTNNHAGISESDIVYETPFHYVLKVSYGFDVYRNGHTHAVRVARIGYPGERGFERSKQDIERRERDLK